MTLSSPRRVLSAVPGDEAGPGVAPSERRDRIRTRLELIIAGASVRMLSERTGINHESLRRMLRRGVINAEYVAALADLYGVSGHWLLTGRGPMFEAGIAGKDVAAPEASVRELIVALSAKMGQVQDGRPGPSLDSWFDGFNSTQMKLRRSNRRLTGPDAADRGEKRPRGDGHADQQSKAEMAKPDRRAASPIPRP
jgi:hypothetical protein